MNMPSGDRYEFFFIAMLALAVLCFGQDTDTTKHQRINLTSRAGKIMPGGMCIGQNGTMNFYGPTIIQRHYFSIEGFEENKRVNYFASNLAPYLKPVPEAYKTIKTYQFYRVATPLLIVAGLATIIGSVAYEASHTTENEFGGSSSFDFTGIFIGVAITLGSWIPHLASKGMVERAVNIYNDDSRVRK